MCSCRCPRISPETDRWVDSKGFMVNRSVSMFDSQRFISIGKHVALIGATLLLLVVSVSSGRTSEVGRGLTMQALRQVVGFRVQNLRRPVNVQTRASRVERSDAEAERDSVFDSASTVLARLHASEGLPSRSYRLIPPYALRPIVRPWLRVGIEAERARSPPNTTARLRNAARLA